MSNDLDQGLSDRYIADLSTKIGSEWPLLGVALGFRQAQLDQLQQAYPRNVSECVRRLLSAWRDVARQHCAINSVSFLAEALTDAGRHDLAQEAKDAFKAIGSSDGQLEKAIQSIVTELRNFRFCQNSYSETDRFLAQTKQCISRWRENSKCYVVTRAWTSAKHDFNRNKILLVCGNSGDGKSTMAYYLLSGIHENGGKVVSVTQPDAIETNFDPEENVVFLVDDAFGTPTVNNQLVEAWIRLHDKLLSFHESGNFGLILTTRTQVLKSCSSRLDGYSFYTKHVIDLDAKENKLSELEKRQILEAYCAYKGVTLPIDVLDQIKSSSLSGFPLLCKLYAADEHLQQVKDFFCTPLSVLSKQLQLLSTVEPVTFCGLVLMLTEDGKLPLSYFDVFSLSDKSKSHVTTIKEACGVEASVPLTKIQDGLETIVGVYVAEYDECYTFIHDAIFDAVTFVFGQKFPGQVLKMCSPKFLHDRVRSDGARRSVYSTQTIKETTYSSSATDVLFIPKAYHKDMVKRFVSDIKKGYLYEVFNNPSIFDVQIQMCILKEFFGLTDMEKVTFLRRRDRNVGRPVMYFVCFQGIFRMAEAFIQHGAELSSDFLLAACNQTKGHEEIVSLLVSQGVDINDQPETSGITALQVAAVKGNDHLLQHLIQLGAYVNIKGENELEAVHLACKSGSESCLGILLHHGANPKAEDTFRRQPIHYAARQGAIECIRSLMECDVDISAKDAFGDEPICMAVECASSSALEFLLDQGANPNTQNKDGKTPLHIACRHGRTENVKILISRGVSLKTQDNLGRQPLHYATASTVFPAGLLSSLVDSNINDKDQDGRTPLHHACRDIKDNSLDKVTVLLNLGANVHESDNTGMQALMYASDSNSLRTVDALIERGAEVQVKGLGGRQPIHFASANGSTEIVALMVDHGADPCARMTDGGRTPIHYACRSGVVSLINYLLNNGADVNERDDTMFTPLFYACYEGHTEATRVLLENGADPDSTDYKGRKAVDMLSFRPCDTKLRELLTKHAPQ